jgi:hypothetical protein
MFPVVKHGPAYGFKPVRCVSIPCFVTHDLRRPVPAVYDVISPSMLGATVPEAAIYEDGDPVPGEGDVYSPSGARNSRQVNTITKPAAVQLSPQRHFGTCVALFL